MNTPQNTTIKSEAGFIATELLVSILIVGILAAVALTAAPEIGDVAQGLVGFDGSSNPTEGQAAATADYGLGVVEESLQQQAP